MNSRPAITRVSSLIVPPQPPWTAVRISTRSPCLTVATAADFVKQITVQRVTKAGLSRIGPAVVTLALAEGLNAHAESVATRLRKAGDRR